MHSSVCWGRGVFAPGVVVSAQRGVCLKGVCLGGCLPPPVYRMTDRQVCPRQVHPLGRYTPQIGTRPWEGIPPRQVHPLGRYTPHPGQIHPPPRVGTSPSRYTPGLVHPPPGQVHPPPGQVHPHLGRYIPQGSACSDTVNKRAVHIPLECILVSNFSLLLKTRLIQNTFN